MNKETRDGKWPYEDIVGLPHHVSTRHAAMPLEKRAAQFAPFAALTGYDDAVAETARLTDSKVELTDEAKEDLNRKINEALAQGREVTITWFVPDEKKAGGAYVESAGRFRDVRMGEVILEDGQRIPAADVIDVSPAEPAGKMG